MIKAIYLERYKRPVIALCLLIIGVCLLNAKLQSDTWHNTQTRYTEDSAERKNFKEYTYWDEASQVNKTYDTYEQYVDANLYFYKPTVNYFNPKVLPKAGDYDRGDKYSINAPDFSTFLVFLIPLVGFLLFFVDAKTGFNHFLFSLPVTRKELFGKKLLYIALPVLLSVLIGQGLYALLIHQLIPAPYMNATLGQLFVSLLNYFSMMVLLFSASAFVGSMVGNLALGPLTWFVFWILMIWVPSSVNAILDTVALRKGALPTVSTNLFIHSVGKAGGYWEISLVFGLISILFLIWSYRNYQTISLETIGDYLVNKKASWPIWFFMTFFSSIVIGTAFFSPWYSYYMNIAIGEPIAIKGPITISLLILVLMGGLSYVLVFFSDIKRKLRQRKAATLSNH